MSNLAAPPALDQVVWQDPARLGGAPCFAGTRVPVRALFDTLRHGRTVGDFLEGFPTVERWQAEAALELAAHGKLGPFDAGRGAGGP